MIFVSKDGDGDFDTIEEAISKADDNELILAKKGIYNEKVVICQNGINLIGEKGTVLTYSNYLKNNSSEKEYAISILGDNFVAEGFVFENATKSNIENGVVLLKGDCAVFKNCELHGEKNILNLGVGMKSYFYNCYIKGQDNIIFGQGISAFDDCQIHFIKEENKVALNIISITSKEINKFCLGFFNCRFTANFSVPTFSLGEYFNDFDKIALMNCKYDSHIIWSDFDKLKSSNKNIKVEDILKDNFYKS